MLIDTSLFCQTLTSSSTLNCLLGVEPHKQRRLSCCPLIREVNVKDVAPGRRRRSSASARDASLMDVSESLGGVMEKAWSGLAHTCWIAQTENTAPKKTLHRHETWCRYRLFASCDNLRGEKISMCVCLWCFQSVFHRIQFLTVFFCFFN